MNIFLLAVCLLAGVFGTYGQEQEYVERFVRCDALKHAVVALSVKQVSDGKVIAAYEPDRALTPASVVKLLPTVLALQEKGENKRFCTSVYYTGNIQKGVLQGNIVIQAGGDPALESRYFPEHLLQQPLLSILEKKGVRCIEGRVIIGGTEKECTIPGSWTWEDVSNYYAALYHPFNYRDNSYTVTLSSAATGEKARLVSVFPSLPDVVFDCRVTGSADNRDNAWIFGGPYSHIFCIQGTIPHHRPAFKIKGAMHQPAKVFIQELERALQKKGIEIRQKEKPCSDLKELITVYSPSLKEIVYITNKRSVNLFAESLGVLVASGKNSWPEEVENLLSEAGIPTSGMILKDACGLSPFNAVPARLFTDLLVYAYNRNDSAFIRSLPVAGIDSGLNGYCRNVPALSRNMKAKTGSMSGVRCLAGYLITRRGKTLAFTILINHYSCPDSQLQRVVGEFLSVFVND